MLATGERTTLQYRPALASELKAVRFMLAEAVTSSPFYDDDFKRREIARYGLSFLRQLNFVDPWYITVADRAGEIIGFTISEPQNGILFCTWCYVPEQYRSTGAALHLIRQSIRHWNEGPFHKISAYVRPDNEIARKVFKVVGFEEIALLKQHVLGHDVILMDRPLKRAAAHYDRGIQLGRLRRASLALAASFGR